MVAQKKNCYWNTGDPVTLDPVCKITYWIQLFHVPLAPLTGTPRTGTGSASERGERYVK